MNNSTIMIDDAQICKTDELKLLGKHNWQNVCAAVTTLWQIAKDPAPLRSVLTTFAGLPHRLEFIREADGVKYYNDSFAATPDAAAAALEAIEGRKIIILGGFERNLPLENLAQTVNHHASDIAKALLVGQSKERLGQALSETGFTNFQLIEEKDMRTFVETSHQTAKSGDSVVFSPGFASFDMFKNFEDRGNQFKREVNAL